MRFYVGGSCHRGDGHEDTGVQKSWNYGDDDGEHHRHDLAICDNRDQKPYTDTDEYVALTSNEIEQKTSPKGNFKKIHRP